MAESARLERASDVMVQSREVGVCVCVYVCVCVKEDWQGLSDGEHLEKLARRRLQCRLYGGRKTRELQLQLQRLTLGLAPC